MPVRRGAQSIPRCFLLKKAVVASKELGGPPVSPTEGAPAPQSPTPPDLDEESHTRELINHRVEASITVQELISPLNI